MRYKYWVPLLLCTLVGCASSSPRPVNTADLSQLKSLDADSVGTMSVSGIRYTALRDAALSVGARAGLAARSKELNDMLIEHDRELERAFNFQLLVLDDNVLPPVLVESRNNIDVASHDVVRADDRSFRIVQQARFISAPPTWRDYLFLDFLPPETPDRTLLPKNKAESLVWDRFVEEGWKAGIAQADNIYQENLGRLHRDINGMIRYRSLLAQNMVSAPFVAKLDLGVTGGGNNLSVNERVLRITDMPSLSKDPNEWQAEIMHVVPDPEKHDMRF